MRRFLDVVQQRAVFLWVLFSIPAVSTFGHYLAPNRPFFKGHDLGVLSALALTLVAAILWVPFVRRRRWPTLTLVFLGTLGVAWIYQITRIQLDGSLFNLGAFGVPIALTAIAFKPVSRQDLYLAVTVFGYSLAVVSLLALLLGEVGVTPSGFDVSDAGADRTGLLSALGLETRWGGPFGSVNYASPVGGVLVVLGATIRGLNRWVFLITGILILTLGQGRTTVFALVLAGLVVVLFSERFRCLKHRIRWRIVIVAGVLISLILYIILIDPTFNGRTPIWIDFYELFMTSPLVGVGETGVLEFVSNNVGEPGFVPHTHGHSVLLDGATRFGLIFALFTVGIYGIALTLGIRALPTGGPGPLGISVFVIAAGSAETIHSWIYWSIYMVILVCAVLIASTPPDRARGTLGPQETSLSSSRASSL